jgi:dihydroneopterin aldolase
VALCDGIVRVDSGQWLCVDGIDVWCTIGVTERERQNKQRLVINLKLGIDFSAVGASDSITDTVDYRLVSRRVIAEVEKASFHLIETLAAHLNRTILAEFPRIEKIATEVWKPGALSVAQNVGAIIVSSRAVR